MYKIGGEVKNIVRNHNYIGKHEWKSWNFVIKKYKEIVRPKYRKQNKTLYYIGNNTTCDLRLTQEAFEIAPNCIDACIHLCNMGWWTFSKIPFAALVEVVAKYIRTSNSVSEYTVVSYITEYYSWLPRENNQVEIMWFRAGMWRIRHAESNCFQMSSQNDYLYPYEIALLHIKTIFRIKHVRGHLLCKTRISCVKMRHLRASTREDK